MGNSHTTVSSTDPASTKPDFLAVSPAERRQKIAANAKLSPRRSGSLLRRNTGARSSMRKQRPMGLQPRRNFLLRRKTTTPIRKPLTPDEKDFLAAAGRGDLEAVLDLLRSDVDIETTDENEMTALHHAAKHARENVIRCLLDRGAKANVSDLTGGFSPLHWVIINSCPPMDSKNHVDESIIALARGGCDLNAKDFNLATPLHIAAQKGYKTTIDTLVRLGANPNAVDVMGRSCLQVAKTNEVKDFIKSLHDKKETVIYHVLEVPPSTSRSPSPPALPAPAKKPCLSSIAQPASPTPPSLLRNLPQFRHAASPGYPAPPPPRSPSCSRTSTPDYSVVDIPLPYKFRPLPVPPTQVPSPLYHYNRTYSSPIPPPPNAAMRRRPSRKMASNSSMKRHRRQHNH